MPAPNPRSSTHYDLLGVKPTASPQQIRRAFRDLSKLYHPDTTELPEIEATEKFQQLNEAYAVLSSPDRRWSYDKQVGYSRISVMQPLESLSKTNPSPLRKEPSNRYLDPTDRPLSAGEIFALFILGLTFVACLALVVTVGLTRSDYAINPEPLAAPAVELSSSLDQKEDPNQASADVPQKLEPFAPERPAISPAPRPPTNPDEAVPPPKPSPVAPIPRPPTWL